MLTSIFAGLAGNAVVGWVSRRVLEIGGWLAAIIPLFMAMPPEYQAVVVAILTGQGGGLSIATAFGFVVYLWSQIMSWRSTMRPHITTSYKQKINVPVLTEQQAREAVGGYTGPIVDRSRR